MKALGEVIATILACSYLAVAGLIILLGVVIGVSWPVWLILYEVVR